jgi:hypothetical protein
VRAASQGVAVSAQQCSKTLFRKARRQTGPFFMVCATRTARMEDAGNDSMQVSAKPRRTG